MNNLEVISFLKDMNILLNDPIEINHDNISDLHTIQSNECSSSIHSEILLNKDIILDKLMNLTLQCVGTLRHMIIEDKETLNTRDHNDRHIYKKRQIKYSSFHEALISFSSDIMSILKSENKQDIKENIGYEVYQNYPTEYRDDINHLSLAIISNYEYRTSTDELKVEYLKSIRSILKHFPSYKSRCDSHGQICYLVDIIKVNSLELMNAIVEWEGIDILRLKDKNGKNSLHYVARYGRSVEMLYLIINKGISIYNILYVYLSIYLSINHL